MAPGYLVWNRDMLVLFEKLVSCRQNFKVVSMLSCIKKKKVCSIVLLPSMSPSFGQIHKTDCMYPSKRRQHLYVLNCTECALVEYTSNLKIVLFADNTILTK